MSHVPVAASIRFAIDAECPMPSALMILHGLLPRFRLSMMRLISICSLPSCTAPEADILGAISDTAPQGDISRVASHNLDDTAALMGGGSISYLIDRLHRRVDRGIKTLIV